MQLGVEPTQPRKTRDIETPRFNLTMSLCIPCTEEDLNKLQDEDTYEGVRTAILLHYLQKDNLKNADVNYAYIYNEDTTEEISVEGLEIDDLLTSIN